MDDDVLAANMSERRRLSWRASLFFLLPVLLLLVIESFLPLLLVCLCLRRWCDEDEEGGGSFVEGGDCIDVDACCSCFCSATCNRAMAVQHGGHTNFISFKE